MDDRVLYSTFWSGGGNWVVRDKGGNMSDDILGPLLCIKPEMRHCITFLQPLTSEPLAIGR